MPFIGFICFSLALQIPEVLPLNGQSFSGLARLFFAISSGCLEELSSLVCFSISLFSCKEFAHLSHE